MAKQRSAIMEVFAREGITDLRVPAKGLAGFLI
jgi:hypothetical protein